MNISIKGRNDYLIVKMNDSIDFENGIRELKELLEKLANNSQGFYPKALFDFGCRKLTNEQFSSLFQLIIEKQSLLFAGFVKEESERKEIVFLEKDIRSGEVLHLKEDTLIKGQINPGAFIYFDKQLYLLGKVHGTLIGTKHSSLVCCQSLRGANLYILDHSLQDLTTFALTKFYIRDNELVKEVGGNEVWLESS